MKRMRSLLHQLRQCCALKGRKTGSSLGMVMIVGTALVIWVMAIMPLMTSTGVTASNTQETQEKYLTSRSSIEFSKSELEKIVETQIPYTFAVLKEDNGTFSALAKRSSGAITPQYTTYVTMPVDSNEDDKDVPKSSAPKEVAAICAVMPGDTASRYNITITTFSGGEKDLTYNAYYTLSGSMLIHPEAYKQTQALPLSDFVLVDGKLGRKVIWNSSIESETDTSFEEHLLAASIVGEEGYADAKEYPVVFKTTAMAAVSEEDSMGDPKKDVELTDEKWILPKANENNTGVENGDIWWDTNRNGSIQIYMKTQKNPELNITEKCDIYLNGADIEYYGLPKATGIYAISIDFEGTADERIAEENPTGYVEDDTNVLPIKGLMLGEQYTVGAGKANTVSECEISNVTFPDKDNMVVTITASNNGKMRYGYTTDIYGNGIVWSDSNEIQIKKADFTSNLYFYAYAPASMDSDGVYHPSSNAVYVGVLYPFVPVTELKNGEEYLIVSANDNSSSCNILTYKNKGIQNTTFSSMYGNLEEGGALSVVPDKSLTWTIVKESNSQKYQITQGTKNDYNGSYKANRWLKFYRERDRWSYNYGLEIEDKKDQMCDLTIKFNGSAANVSYMFDDYYWQTYRYLRYYDSWISSDSAQNIYFIKRPVEVTPVASVAVNDTTYNSTAIQTVYAGEYGYSRGDIEALTGVDFSEFYVNGTNFSGNVGAYQWVGIKEDASVVLGTLEVQKAALDASVLVPTVTKDENNDQKITISSSGWNGESGGIRYIGYKKSTETEYSWFEAQSDNTCAFYLELDGSYNFAVSESGTNNYAGATKSYSDPETGVAEYKVVATPFNLDASTAVQFVYYVNADVVQTDKNGYQKPSITWYEFPEGVPITPNKLEMVFAYYNDAGELVWTRNFEADKRYSEYGVIIQGATVSGTNETNTVHIDGKQVLVLGAPSRIAEVNGHVTSELHGSALYFMGGDASAGTNSAASIDTYGNEIMLTADLLVIKDDIWHSGVEDRGHVYVTPYSQEDVLVYFGNGMATDGGDQFEAETFYLIDASYIGCICHAHPSSNDKIQKVGDLKEAETLFKRYDNPYPEINLDIAYATSSQLMQIVSGETIGWTTDGVLKGSDASNDYNYEYCVAAYVSKVEGYVDRHANRVIIAAVEEDDNGNAISNSLIVPDGINFLTRYLSIETDNIVQGREGIKFILKNLGEDWNFLKAVFSTTISKTLQMDFERVTKICFADGSQKEMQARIYRYDDGADLFNAETEGEDLIVPYTSDELNDLADFLDTTVKIVDRYIEMSKGNRGFKLDGFGGGELYIYSNYIYFDESMTDLTVSGLWVSEGDIIINSQESGYTSSNEYLKWFASRYSGESYTGTLLYLKSNLKIVYREAGFLVSEKSVTLPAGIYHIEAVEGGTSLIDVANDVKRNGSNSKYVVSPEELKDIAVYINPDGSMNDAFVDSGIWDSESGSAATGFTGGSMK